MKTWKHELKRSLKYYKNIGFFLYYALIFMIHLGVEMFWKKKVQQRNKKYKQTKLHKKKHGLKKK